MSELDDPGHIVQRTESERKKHVFVLGSESKPDWGKALWAFSAWGLLDTFTLSSRRDGVTSFMAELSESVCNSRNLLITLHFPFVELNPLKTREHALCSSVPHKWQRKIAGPFQFQEGEQEEDPSLLLLPPLPFSLFCPLNSFILSKDKGQRQRGWENPLIPSEYWFLFHSMEWSSFSCSRYVDKSHVPKITTRLVWSTKGGWALFTVRQTNMSVGNTTFWRKFQVYSSKWTRPFSKTTHHWGSLCSFIMQTGCQWLALKRISISSTMSTTLLTTKEQY